MSIEISPLDLVLDEQNPRFLALEQRNQTAIRKYMAMYEDVCDLARDLNANNGLLLGERIVVIKEDNHYIVMEGNRRTCALQFLLNRNLIPDGFQHQIVSASEKTLINIKKIEVDVAPDRNYAVLLMAKRHIAGVKQWKPLAKKQFFANMFLKGNTISALSMRTGIGISSIRKDISDYKFLLLAANWYKKAHPNYKVDLISYQIVPFLRIFSAKQKMDSGIMLEPSAILKIKYDDEQNTYSDLPDDIFQKIVQLVFESTIVHKTIGTRNTLFDVEGVKALLDTISHTNDNVDSLNQGSQNDGDNVPGQENRNSGSNGDVGKSSAEGKESGVGSPVENVNRVKSGGNTGTENTVTRSTSSGFKSGRPVDGGPTGGGDAPPAFFEHISWSGKLDPSNNDHVGLIVALDELYRMSRNTTKKSNGNTVKVYRAYPVGAGMLLRTAYEQALILQLKKTGLWIELKKEIERPMLSNLEDKIKKKPTVALPDEHMRSAFSQIVKANSRGFLNANVHKPWLIRATTDTLEGISNGGMFSLIQLIIDNL